MNCDWEKLAAGVYRCRLPFLDVSVGMVAGSLGILLIDCGTTPSEAAAIAADVKRLARGRVTHVVLTHDHFDHVLGSAGFPDARLYAAAPVASTLRDGAALRNEALRYGADRAGVDAAVSALRAPDVIVGEAGLMIDLGSRTATVTRPLRGHTDHDLVAVVAADGESTVVFCGDLVEESGDPSVGADSDLASWPAALDDVLALGGPHAKYVPGHGATVDAGFVRAQRDWLATQA